jgi:hypothetical protein
MHKKMQKKKEKYTESNWESLFVSPIWVTNMSSENQIAIEVIRKENI